jgi:hypothetical protein
LSHPGPQQWASLVISALQQVLEWSGAETQNYLPVTAVLKNLAVP